MLPISLAVFGTPTHIVQTTNTFTTTIDPGNCPNNLSQAILWIENLRTFLDNDPTQPSEATKTLIALNRITHPHFSTFVSRWYDRIVDQSSSTPGKLFDILIQNFKLATARLLSRKSPQKTFYTMNPQEQALHLQQHPTLMKTLSPSTKSTFPPAFRKWNPVERAKYLRQRHPSPEINNASPITLPRLHPAMKTTTTTPAP